MGAATAWRDGAAIYLSAEDSVPCAVATTEEHAERVVVALNTVTGGVVALGEREACARLCEAMVVTGRAWTEEQAAAAHALLAAAKNIRARGPECESATVEALTAERDAMRAIIEGRTVAPTDAEVAAHEAQVGGGWRLVIDRAQGARGFAEFSGERTPFVREVELARNGRWWPLDKEGRPCAWPVAAGQVSP